jgi:transcriptional regulator with XRE-family HTH domain
MTADELRQARSQLGVSGAEFARAFDVSERTLRSWEGAIHNKRLIPVPRTVAILTKLALKNPSIRRELGLTKAKSATPQEPNAQA